MKILYQACGTASGGRNGRVTTDDGSVDMVLAMPRELGGTGAKGANPEQFFACGYAACFDSALAFVASKSGRSLSGSQVQASVGIGPHATGGFALAVTLTISLPGVPDAEAVRLMEEAHRICPYSNAVRGNIDVMLTLKQGQP